MKVDREELLRKLEAVAPGLSAKEAVEQSSCFVFMDGRVITFNDEIACSIACDLALKGAIVAMPLLNLLTKLVEKEIDITEKEGGAELLVKGKGRRAGITLEAEIALPIGAVDMPDSWNKLDPEFADAVGVVQQCASKDANNFHLTCIHITPDYVEACDNFQLARYPVQTGVGESCLVKRDSLKHVTGLGMTEISETKTWLHFRNPVGLILSVRREVLDYEDLGPILDMEGVPTTLPGGLAEAVEKAEIFSAENSENNVVLVELKNDQLRIKGVGVTGWYEERKSVKYEGDPISFSISPKLLVDVTARTNDCFITAGRLKISNGKFEYVTCLGKVE